MSVIDSLESSSIELPNRAEVEQLLKEFQSLSATILSVAAELKHVATSVSCWWPDCIRAKEIISEFEMQLAEDMPFSGSLEVIRQQDELLQVTILLVL